MQRSDIEQILVNYYKGANLKITDSLFFLNSVYAPSGRIYEMILSKNSSLTRLEARLQDGSCLPIARLSRDPAKCKIFVGLAALSPELKMVLNHIKWFITKYLPSVELEEYHGKYIG